jgi:translation initiation factor 3 subunit F
MASVNDTHVHQAKACSSVLTSEPAFLPLVQAGKRKGSTVIGRYLAETVAAVPHFTRDDFERMLADQQNDCTLVLFLSKLIQAHLALADKLGTMQLPLL